MLQCSQAFVMLFVHQDTYGEPEDQAKHYAASSLVFSSNAMRRTVNSIVFLVSGEASATVPEGSSFPECRLWVEATRTEQ